MENETKLSTVFETYIFDSVGQIRIVSRMDGHLMIARRCYVPGTSTRFSVRWLHLMHRTWLRDRHCSKWDRAVRTRSTPAHSLRTRRLYPPFV